MYDLDRYQFTVFGVIAIVILFFTLGDSKHGKYITTFLSVVLLSMVLINWQRIAPLFIRRV